MPEVALDRDFKAEAPASRTSCQSLTRTSGRMWLSFPLLLLSALPAALLRGAAGFTPSLDSDFTFTLPAGRKECFYQPMPLKASLEIEYQVSTGVSWPSLGWAAPHGRLSPAWKTRGRRPR